MSGHHHSRFSREVEPTGFTEIDSFYGTGANDCGLASPNAGPASSLEDQGAVEAEFESEICRQLAGWKLRQGFCVRVLRPNSILPLWKPVFCLRASNWLAEAHPPCGRQSALLEDPGRIGHRVMWKQGWEELGSLVRLFWQGPLRPGFSWAISPTLPPESLSSFVGVTKTLDKWRKPFANPSVLSDWWCSWVKWCLKSTESFAQTF